DPKFDVKAVQKAIATRAEKVEAVAIVGHEPQLSSLLAALSKVSPADLDLEKGAIVRIDVSTLTDGASADPRWWLKPKGTRKKGLPLRKQPGSRSQKPGPHTPNAWRRRDGAGVRCSRHPDI